MIYRPPHVKRTATHRPAVSRKLKREKTTAGLLLDSVLPSGDGDDSQSNSLQQTLSANGFDREQHEQIRSDLRSGRIGLAQNRLPNNTTIQDVSAKHVIDVRDGVEQKYTDLGAQAIADGKIAVVTLAAGVGSRWTQGAGVCKALHPFNKFAGRHRSFLEVHLAKNRAITKQYGGSIPHMCSRPVT